MDKITKQIQKDFYLLSTKPLKFFYNKKNRFRAGNRYFQRKKSGGKQMITLLILGLLINLTELGLAGMYIHGNLFFGLILKSVLIFEFLIKAFYVFNISGSIFYSIIISIPPLTGIVGLWNWVQSKIIQYKKPRTL